MATVSIDQVLQHTAMPSLPTVAVEVLKLTRDPKVNMAELARIVENDQALCGKILKTVNSSYYALSKPCSTISRALAYLGLSTVKSLVLGFSLVDVSRHGDHDFDFVNYWRRAVFSAAAARRIGMMTRHCDPEEAFIAALMQDIGMLALNAALGTAYTDVANQFRKNHEALAKAEREAFGFDHAEVGARLGEFWRFPVELIEPIRYHHSNLAIRTVQCAHLCSTVQFAFALTTVLDKTDAAEAARAIGDMAYQSLGLGNREVCQLLPEVTEDAASLTSLLNVKTGGPPKIGQILAEADQARLEMELEAVRKAEELRESNERLTMLATTDGLTGVGNRQSFDDELESCFRSAHVNRGALGLILIDVDHFKAPNDTYGHQFGDEVLIHVASRIREVVGRAGVVCRYGGDEFAVVLPNATRPQAAQIAENIRKSVGSRAFDVEKDGLELQHIQTTSIGVAALEPDCAQVFTTASLLIQAADRALFAAKAAGRNCVRVFRLAAKKQPAA